MTALWFCTAEVEEEEEEEERLMTVAVTASSGGVLRGPLASCWVSLSMLRTVADRRCLFLCEAFLSAAGGRRGEEEARVWTREWDGGKRTAEAAAREGWGSLGEAVEEGEWLLCKVLFVTFDGCCWASFNTSRGEDKPPAPPAAAELWPWVIWLAS